MLSGVFPPNANTTVDKFEHKHQSPVDDADIGNGNLHIS